MRKAADAWGALKFHDANDARVSASSSNAGYLAGDGTNGGYGKKGRWQFDIADYEVFVISDTAGKVPPTPPPPTTTTTTTTA